MIIVNLFIKPRDAQINISLNFLADCADWLSSRSRLQPMNHASHFKYRIDSEMLSFIY